MALCPGVTGILTMASPWTVTPVVPGLLMEQLSAQPHPLGLRRQPGPGPSRTVTTCGHGPSCFRDWEPQRRAGEEPLQLLHKTEPRPRRRQPPGPRVRSPGPCRGRLPAAPVPGHALGSTDFLATCVPAGSPDTAPRESALEAGAIKIHVQLFTRFQPNHADYFSLRLQESGVGPSTSV